MLKKIVFFYCLFLGLTANAQVRSNQFRSKKFVLVKDTIQIDTVNINSQKFKVFDSNNKIILPSSYKINFIKAQLIINAKKHPSITVEYFLFPDFVTKNYKKFDKNIIVPNTKNTQKLYSLTTNRHKKSLALFNQLETKGNITRGLTIGNNQNSVVNSSLDLTIQGNLSKNVTIKANIFDTNIPLQNNGYSQNITDFDRIFIEFEHKNWRVKAGDLDLKNTASYFMPFTKKVSGLEVAAKISKTLNVLASGAIVRGRFNTFKFLGKEGNQGPYKIIGKNNESFIIIVAGSESLYVNGELLNRGKEKDYTIDYNNSEIRFNTTFPVTNDMRFHIDYQFSDSNYTRFITYEKANYKTENWKINGFFYNENDAKNQPIQQNLTDTQKETLANAGNDISKMIASSAYRDVYSDSRILYKKQLTGTLSTFKYSTDSNDELYNVTFTFVGPNKGDYSLDKTIAIGNIYTYVGVNLGDHSPIIRLVAPSKTQITAFNSTYTSKKTSVFGEIALSNNDANLFSSIDDTQNKGAATKLNWKQLFIDSDLKFSTDLGYEYVAQNFSTLQRFQAVEFERDWNIISPSGNRNQFNLFLNLRNKKKSSYTYGIHFMNYTANYKGIKQDFKSKTQLDNTVLKATISLLKNTTSIEKNNFLRINGNIEHSLKTAWIGAFIKTETNKKRLKISQELTNLSHQFKEYEMYFGLGDSTKTYTKIGLNYRLNDSIRNHTFTRTNTKKTLYINSQLIQSPNANLSIFANYRITNNTFSDNEKALNSSITYRQKLFNNFINIHSIYQTSSGNIPRQEYVYIKTEPGQGYYTWIDYNNNGVKEFNEFEIALYKDQAAYLRIALPNLNFINTQRAKLTQVLTTNPSQWSSKKGIKKLISHFYNQTNFSINNEQERSDNTFNLNPFDIDKSKLLGLNYSVRNSLFLNRNLQKYSFVFTYSKSKNNHLYSIGSQEFNTTLHQLDFLHKLSDFWLLDFTSNISKDQVNTENFSNQNYQINAFEIRPKFTFEHNKNHHFSFFYNFKKKKNIIASFETLQQQKLGTSYYYKSKRGSLINAELNLFFNDFTGNRNSPVAYQMLEGLQAGKNYTWSLIFQQNINSFINVNVNYLARKSENSSIIHTGSVQLRADL